MGDLKEVIIDCWGRTYIDKEQTQDLIDLQSSRDMQMIIQVYYTKIIFHPKHWDLQRRNGDIWTDSLKMLALQYS